MLKFGLSATLLLAAVPALSQTQAPAPVEPQASAPADPEAEIERTAEAFSHCLGKGIQAVPANASPEAGAAGILEGCDRERDQLEQAVEAMLAPLEEEQKTEAREQFRTAMAAVEADIAEGIREQRGVAAPPPAE